MQRKCSFLNESKHNNSKSKSYVTIDYSTPRGRHLSTTVIAGAGKNDISHRQCGAPLLHTQHARVYRTLLQYTQHARVYRTILQYTQHAREIRIPLLYTQHARHISVCYKGRLYKDLLSRLAAYQV